MKHSQKVLEERKVHKKYMIEMVFVVNMIKMRLHYKHSKFRPTLE
jgi:hypothetical protein